MYPENISRIPLGETLPKLLKTWKIYQFTHFNFGSFGSLGGILQKFLGYTPRAGIFLTRFYCPTYPQFSACNYKSPGYCTSSWASCISIQELEREIERDRPSYIYRERQAESELLPFVNWRLITHTIYILLKTTFLVFQIISRKFKINNFITIIIKK